MLVTINFKVTKKLSLLKGTITFQRNLVETITKTITITVTFGGLETAIKISCHKVIFVVQLINLLSKLSRDV